MNENETKKVDPLVEAAQNALELQKPIEVTKVPEYKETVANAIEVAEDDDVFVSASTAEEMNLAQQRLIGWAQRRTDKLQSELDDATANLELAKKRKWATDSHKRAVAKAQKKVDFYVKVKAALEAGYTIIPDMPMDIFAIRTTKKTPKRNQAAVSNTYTSRGPTLQDQVSNSPPLEAGKYVSPQAVTDYSKYEHKKADGTIVPMHSKWAVEFDEEIDFPFKMAKPVVMEKTAVALSKKIFDEVGVAPSKRAAQFVKGGDPIVIGRIVYRNGRRIEKVISFLVTWFIDSKDL